MPLAFMFVFGSFRGSSGSASRARLTVENRDSGFLSTELLQALRDENVHLVDSLPEGAEAVRTLIIPPDFTRRVLSREQVTLVLRRDEGANLSASEAVSMSIVKGIMRVVPSLIELETKALAKGTEHFSIAADTISGSLWKLVGGHTAGLDSLRVAFDSLQSRERIVSVDATVAGKRKDIPHGFQGSVPGSLVMFVLMSMAFGGMAITIERESGVLRRLGVTPARAVDVVMGKLLGRMWVAGIQILFLLAAGKFLFRISLGNNYLALVLLMVAFAFCTGAYSILFGSLFRKPEQVAGVAVITTLIMSALGGCWWPMEVVSRPFQILAFAFPTGWAMNGLHKILSFGLGTEAVIPHVMVLVAFGAAFLLGASKKLKWTA